MLNILRYGKRIRCHLVNYGTCFVTNVILIKFKFKSYLLYSNTIVYYIYIKLCRNNRI